MQLSSSLYFLDLRNGINQIISVWESKLLNLPVEVISQRKNSQNRTIKQLIGHLIDSASNNQQRMVRSQYNPELIFPDYTQSNDLWIAIQNYQESDWTNLVSFWKCYNLHIIQIIENVDVPKLDNTWADFEGNVVTLQEMLNGYLEHLKLHMSEIEELINRE